MKEYDVITVGTGSAMLIVDAMMQRNPKLKAAVIDKDEPGGICLTRGCIPSKILLYPAELVRTLERARQFGIDVDLKHVDFSKVMKRMRSLIDREIDQIREGLSASPNIDYYHAVAEFTAPYTLRVQNEIIRSNFILLCAGSKPLIPPIKGLQETGYHTSDTILHMPTLPQSIAVVGGGYIAAEYGHFLSAMGSEVTIIGRNRQFLPEEEPEVSALAKRELSKHISILTSHEVIEAEKKSSGKKEVVAINRESRARTSIEADEILIAAGRGSNSDILHPERAGIETDEKGWIKINDFLQTSQPNVWAMGDANGKHLFKHVANYEAELVYYNALMQQNVRVDYHAVPHAVFTYPEIASVGMREKEAIETLGSSNVSIGFKKYEDTAKGEAMGVKDYFVKVIVERESLRIIGAHIIGPYASVLIQEIINLMYTPEQSLRPIFYAMHIHPALSEVVQRAAQSLMPPEEYHHLLQHNQPT
jgi:mycothione reductase